MAAFYVNDDYMTYDLAAHRYTLTPRAVLDLRGIDLSQIFTKDSDADIAAFLTRVSVETYLYIYAGVRDREVSQYMAAQPRYRDAIRDAMLEQAYTMLTSRADPTAFFSDRAGTRTLSIAAALALDESGAHFRGKWTNYDPKFLDGKGVDY